MSARRAAILSLVALACGCAQSVVSSSEDRGPRPPRDASEARDDGGGRVDDDGGPMMPGPDGSMGPDRGPSMPDSGPSTPDSGPGPASPCMRRFQEDIQVPPPPAMAGFAGVRGLAFDAGRRLYVLSRTGPPYVGWVTVLGPAPEHALVRTFGRDQLRAVNDLMVDGSGNVHVVDDDLNGSDPPVIHVYDPQGAFIRTWTADGGGADEGVAITGDDAGRIYVGGLVVSRYTATGVYLDTIGLWGSSAGRIGRARGLAYDPRGFLWVADLARNMVHQFDVSTRGQVIELGGRGVGPGLFDGDADPEWRWGPTRLALDANGAIYANDPYVSRIQKLSRQGTFLGEFSFGNAMELGALAVEPTTGSVYVGRGTAVAIVCAL